MDYCNSRDAIAAITRCEPDKHRSLSFITNISTDSSSSIPAFDYIELRLDKHSEAGPYGPYHDRKVKPFWARHAGANVLVTLANQHFERGCNDARVVSRVVPALKSGPPMVSTGAKWFRIGAASDKSQL